MDQQVELANNPVIPRRGLFSAFWATVIICLALLAFIFLQDLLRLDGQAFRIMLLTGTVLLILSGGILIYFTVTSQVPRPLRLTLLWTGISAAGIPVCAVLHNLVYGLFIVVFGKEFWGQGGDEPVFFILAIIVFPVVFLVCTVWSIWLIIRGARSAPAAAPPA